jgi:hypothetical protein
MEPDFLPNAVPEVVPNVVPEVVPEVVPDVVPGVVPGVVPEVVNGENFIAELGVARFKWTIRDFKEFLEIGQTIISPSFNMETTDPLSKVRSFHLEMASPRWPVRVGQSEMASPRPISSAEFPIFLVNETGGEILTKISLEDFGPKEQGGRSIVSFGGPYMVSFVKYCVKSKYRLPT